MQGLPSIHVIIPTGGRPETIWSTLRSCSSQTYPNLTIWVSDNSFESATAEIIDKINDKRIRRIQPTSRLCMAENWEFAISHIHDGFMTIIGDDDCLMPESIGKVADLIRQNPDLSILNHLPASYYWPNFPNRDLANKIHIRPMDFRTYRIDSQSILSKVCAFESWYGHLPVLYHGFVSTELIAKIRKKSNGTFFNFCAPDIYAAIVLAMHTERFLRVNSALTVGGQSGRSSGANYALETEIGKKFTAELPARLHFRYESMSISLAVFEALENAFHFFPELQPRFPVNKQKLLKSAIADVSSLNDHLQTQLKEKLLLIYPAKVVIQALADADEQNRPTLSEAGSPRVLEQGFIRGLTKVAAVLKRKLWKRSNQTRTTDTTNIALHAKPQDFYLDDGWMKLEHPIDVACYAIDSVEKAALFLQNKIDSLSAGIKPNSSKMMT
jgi:glycosyltransferase involved in cell wall biosynthesis